MLFDASKLSVEENKRQCIEVVAEARRYGAHVEGEIEGFKRTEEMTGDEAEHVQSLETVVDFVHATGVDVFAPAIGNAHGVYATTPHLDSQRVTDIVAATGIPVALHGGTGHDPGAVQRPDRPGLRQGEHLDRPEDRLHEVGLRVHERASRASTTRPRSSRRSGPP